MTLELEIRLKCDGQVTALAHETAHLAALTETQRHEAQRIAKAAIQLLAGERVLARSLHEHLNSTSD